jgi:serine/threonine-protein kinase RIM15
MMDDGLEAAESPALPALASLRASQMERSLSEDIREEREELREAAEQTLNVIMDLNIDGTIRWVSPSWVDVIGTPIESVPGTRFADLIVSENKSIFADIIESMKKDDSRSQFIRFAVKIGQLSKLLPMEDIKEPEASSEENIVELEAQGIMVYDGGSEEESHVCFTSHVVYISLGVDLLTYQSVRPCG